MNLRSSYKAFFLSCYVWVAFKRVLSTIRHSPIFSQLFPHFIFSIQLRECNNAPHKTFFSFLPSSSLPRFLSSFPSCYLLVQVHWIRVSSKNTGYLFFFLRVQKVNQEIHKSQEENEEGRKSRWRRRSRKRKTHNSKLLSFACSGNATNIIYCQPLQPIGFKWSYNIR